MVDRFCSCRTKGESIAQTQQTTQQGALCRVPLISCRPKAGGKQNSQFEMLMVGGQAIRLTVQPDFRLVGGPESNHLQCVFVGPRCPTSSHGSQTKRRRLFSLDAEPYIYYTSDFQPMRQVLSTTQVSAAAAPAPCRVTRAPAATL